MKSATGKSHSNGVSVPNQAKQPKQAPPLPVPASPGAVSPVVSHQMPEALHQELLEMLAQGTQLKIQIADKLMELRALEVMGLQESENIRTRIAGFAAAHGVDLNNLEHGRWNFDFPSGLLTKKVG